MILHAVTTPFLLLNLFGSPTPLILLTLGINLDPDLAPTPALAPAPALIYAFALLVLPPASHTMDNMNLVPSPSLNYVLGFLAKDSEHVHTSVSKNDLSSVSDIAPSVVSVSSFLGVTKIFDHSGLIIDRNSCNNEATILTSAKLVWRPKNSGFETHLIVRLGDGTLLLATEDYADFYHSLVTLMVQSAIELKVVDLTAKQADIIDGMNVRALGRSFYTCSLIDSTRELHLEDPLFGCDNLLRSTCSASGICEGGPLISVAGFVVGMNFNGKCVCAHLLPTPIILNCLEMWRSYRFLLMKEYYCAAFAWD